MTFDLRMITVDYGEWTLWVSLFISTPLAVLVGTAVGRRVASIGSVWLKWLSGAAAAGTLWFGMTLAGLAAFEVLFMAANGGAGACTVLVGRALLVPPIAAIASGAIGWWTEQRSEDARGRPTRA
jgi:hypothetical protein